MARHRAFTLFDVEDESKSEAYSEAVVHECEYFAQEELYCTLNCNCTVAYLSESVKNGYEERAVRAVAPRGHVERAAELAGGRRELLAFAQQSAQHIRVDTLYTANRSSGGDHCTSLHYAEEKRAAEREPRAHFA